MPVYLVIIKENSINFGASDQFPTAISRIWFLFCQHVIQLSFIFCVHGLSAWVWTFVFCELNISLLKWSISSLAPSPTLCVDYLWGGELGILWDARFEFYWISVPMLHGCFNMDHDVLTYSVVFLKQFNRLVFLILKLSWKLFP